MCMFVMIERFPKISSVVLVFFIWMAHLTRLLARWMKIKNNMEVFDPDGRSTDDKILLKKIFIKIQLGSIFKVQFIYR